MQAQAVIFGGGAAGLWLLDTLTRQGLHVLLLEAHELGAGQTIASQGIIHGGLKYTLQGLFTKSANHVREMPAVWRKSLLGTRSPNLTRTRVRSDECFLWQTNSLASRAGMIGARVGLVVAPEVLPADQRPAALQHVPGTVARLAEQVISPRTFVEDLFQQYRDRILKFDADRLEFTLRSPGEIASIRLAAPGGRTLEVEPHHVIFTAGAGNAELRRKAGLSTTVMQRRPLHMVMARGNLPELNGHCVDGAKTRVTITSDLDGRGRRVWQIGGQVAEEGVALEPAALVRHTQAEVQAVLPGVDLSRSEWGTYRVDRAEGATANGSRPETVQMLCAGNVTTGWPTKLVLAPVLAQEIADRVVANELGNPLPLDQLADWPRPAVAAPPWDACPHWTPFIPHESSRVA